MILLKDLKANHHFWAFILLIIFRYGQFICKLKINKIFKFIFLLPYFLGNAFIIEGLLHCHFPLTAQIDSGLSLFHPYEIMLNRHVKIGKNVVLRNGVTIGVKYQNGYGGAIVGNNVDVGTGAKIIGKIKIGDNTIIGANAVVTKDFGADLVIAGVPAKVLRKKN